MFHPNFKSQNIPSPKLDTTNSVNLKLPTACADAKQLRITPRCKCSKMAAKCGITTAIVTVVFNLFFPRYNMVLTWYNHNIHNCFQIFQYHSSCSSPTFYDTWLFRIGAVECRGDLMQRATSGSRHLVIEWLTLQPTISGCIEMYRKTS